MLCACLTLPEFDVSKDFKKEEYNELGYKSGSSDTYGTHLGVFLRVVAFAVCVTLSDN